jgi:hypothetical protein
MMSVSVEVMKTKRIFKNFVFFCPSRVLNPKSLAWKFYALPTEPADSEIILLKVVRYTPESFEAGENFQFIFYFDELS